MAWLKESVQYDLNFDYKKEGIIKIFYERRVYESVNSWILP